MFLKDGGESRSMNPSLSTPRPNFGVSGGFFLKSLKTSSAVTSRTLSGFFELCEIVGPGMIDGLH